MKYLIDTHIFIWFIQSSPNLNITSRRLIENPNNQIFLSIVGLWEISIKNSLGKLHLIRGFEAMTTYLQDNSIEILPLEFAHTVENNRLPFHHRDPFDRIMISQAIVENIDFISADAVFDDYLKGTSISRIW